MSASTAPIFSTASAMPSPGRPGLHLVDQRRHRLAPDLGLDLVGDRLVGDDLGAVLGEREIDEDAGAAARLQLAAGPEQLDRAAVDPAASWSRPGSAPCAAAARRADSGRSGRRRPSSRTGASITVAPRRAPRSSRAAGRSPSRSSPAARPRTSAGTSSMRQHRIMERDVVIGVGAARRRW